MISGNDGAAPDAGAKGENMLNDWPDREPPPSPQRLRRWFVLLCALGALSLLAPLAAWLLR